MDRQMDGPLRDLRVAFALFGFNRPQYLQQVIDSVDRAEDKDDIDFFYFQDGAVNFSSGRRWARDETIQTCQHIVGSAETQYRIVPFAHNFGPAILQMRSSEMLFDAKDYDVIIGLVDDFIVAKSFFHIRKVLINQFWPQKQIFSVQHCYMCFLPREEKSRHLNKYLLCKNMPSPGGWALFKPGWQQILPYYRDYYNYISKTDYALRDHAAITKKFGIRSTGHDGGLDRAIQKTDLYGVWPVVNRCRDIGTLGLNKRPVVHAARIKQTQIHEFQEDMQITEFVHAPDLHRTVPILRGRV